MLKKYFPPILVLLSALTLQVEAAPEENITMLVAPRSAKTIQIAQDISQHYPILLVSYQQTPDQLKLYAWNGTGWVDISMEDYKNGAFFENRPQHTILIDSEDAPAPNTLIPDGLWCERGNRLTSSDPRVIIHLLGRYLDFPNRRWKQFARDYGYQVGEINPALLNIYWWQYPPECPTRNLKADMNNWFFLDITPPPPIEPILTEEKPAPIPPVEIPADVSSDLSAGALTEAEALTKGEEGIEKIAEEPPVLVVEEVEELPEVVPSIKEAVPVTETAQSFVIEVSAPEETVEGILNALTPATEVSVDPFSDKEIPAAEVVQ